MNVVPKTRMTVDEFLAWAIGEPGRYELADGEVHAMSPETASRVDRKFAVQVILAGSLRARGLPCRMMADGMTVRIDEATAYEPDALVYCGPKIGSGSMEVRDPVIVVEVLSRSTRRIDTNAKLAGYFRLPSLAHYLIVEPDKPLIIHHARGAGDTILTRIVTDGVIDLDPPGLSLSVAEIYAA